jgi:hypothetical protein
MFEEELSIRLGTTQPIFIGNSLPPKPAGEGFFQPISKGNEMVKVSESAELKKALHVLKSMVAFAASEAPQSKPYKEPVFEFLGSRLCYHSSEGCTVGVDLPLDVQRLPAPLFLPLKTLRAALYARPGVFDVDMKASSINGVSFEPTRCVLNEGDRPFDVNQHFGRVKTLVKLPLPEQIKGVRMAEATEDIRFYLNGMCIDLGRHALVATDGYRMHVANSATLPTIDDARLKALLPHADEGRYRIVLANWQLNLLRSIQASEIAIARFPDRDEALAALPNWRHPEPKSGCLLVRARGTYGFFIGKSVDGIYPDWPKVVPGQAELEKQRSAALENATAKDVQGIPWRSECPRRLKIKASVANDLRRFVRAERASKSSQYRQAVNPSVVMDLQRGVIHSSIGSSVMVEISIEMMDELHYPRENEKEHVVVLNASFLADAIEYLGDGDQWWVSPSSRLIGYQGALSAVVMPIRC